MNQVYVEKIKEVKFTAFVNGYSELLQFLDNIQITDTIYGHDLTSPWFEKDYNDMGDLGDPDWVEDHNEFVKITKEIKRRENCYRLVVKQGRKCGLKFYQSNIQFAQLKI